MASSVTPRRAALAEALGNEGEASEILGDLSLINLNDLLGAVPYLVPTYRKTDVTFVNDGVVKADVAGGFAGDFQSGEVNQFSKKDLEDDPSLVDVKTSVEANPWAVINIARVEGGAYDGWLPEASWRQARSPMRQTAA